MTPLNKQVRRLGEARVRDRSRYRQLVVSLHPGDFIGLRMQGCRQLETFPIDALYSIAVKARVARERAERKAGRRNKWSQ
jgi:hypothetical protein